jgi:aspartyl protease family protein
MKPRLRPLRCLPRRRAGAALLLACAFSLPVAAQPAAGGQSSVQFAGAMGSNKALLVINGSPRTLAVGESHAGVTLKSLKDGVAEIERGGAIVTLRLGAAPVAVGGGVASGSAAREIVLTAGLGGHFVTQGLINGKPVQFMVDTGATSIAMSRADAERIGLDWKAGRPMVSSTANGLVQVHGLTLSAVRVGEVTLSNVAAVVVPAPMPHVLLGNSFLSRFQMRRDNDVMRLELR